VHELSTVDAALVSTTPGRGRKATDSLRLDSVLDTLDDGRDDSLEVPIVLVVPKPQELPRLRVLVPHDLDHAIFVLLFALLPSTLSSVRAEEENERTYVSQVSSSTFIMS
jgi:hypothetical protein